jgi:hypothetical protein
MKRLPVAVLFLALSSCATPQMERSPAYELGYSDGCASAAAEGPGVPRNPRRNEMLYTMDAEYRAGWASGNAQCRVQGPNRL